MKLITLALALNILACAGRDDNVTCKRPSPTDSVQVKCIKIEGPGCPTCDNASAIYSPGIITGGSSSHIASSTSCMTVTDTQFGNGDYSTEVEEYSADGLTENDTLTVTTPNGTCVEYQEVTFTEN